MSSDKKHLGFELTSAQSQALKEVSGGRQVRLSGKVTGGKFVVDFIACNAPFVACNAPFTACNSPFTACNAPFSE
jgi:RecG-like helicase